ncbi:MAG: NAD(P)/FAD-dependent oxidoreductase [Clostridia bacterium]|nr:NAD(P)/FAD-dependent oxidoreductase [Clostridia bacterium]
MYEIAIIGGGPAGVSAAINAKILNKDFIWFSSRAVSAKLERAELIKNYPGLPDVTGSELGWTLKNHCESMNIQLCEEVITGVYDTGGKFTLFAGNKDYEAKSVILCIGVQTQKPYDGEEKLLGRGVSYCATCDGLLYKGKKIAIICTDKRYEHEIDYLCKIAEKVYVVPLYKDYSVKAENAEIILKQPLSIGGDMRADSVKFKDREIAVDGVFILRSSVSPSTLVHGLAVEDGHIAVNRRMETNLNGIFAAGDCVGRPYQYIKSAGEGNIAVHSAVEYLAENSK